MGAPGSRPAFAVKMVVAALLGLVGVSAIVSGRVSGFLLGAALIGLAAAISRQAKKARAAYVHEQDMQSRWQWAQGLGPRKEPRR